MFSNTTSTSRFLAFAFLLSTLLIGSCSKKADPVPVVSITSAFFSGGTYTFSAVSSSTGLTYTWDFGDGAMGSGFQAVHTYARNGTYLVRLNATGSGGTATATYSQNVGHVLGNATFWVTKTITNRVYVLVDGTYGGYITQSYAANPGCSAAGCLVLTNLTEGVHTFTAKEDKLLLPVSWTGSITVTGGSCSVQGLLY